MLILSVRQYRKRPIFATSVLPHFSWLLAALPESSGPPAEPPLALPLGAAENPRELYIRDRGGRNPRAKSETGSLKRKIKVSAESQLAAPKSARTPTLIGNQKSQNGAKLRLGRTPKAYRVGQRVNAQKKP